MKIDLQKDKATLRRYIEGRIRDYPVYENLGPGDDDSPIASLTLGYYAAQSGDVDLVFDTRPVADVDGEWTEYMGNETNTVSFPDWHVACMAICDGKTVTVVQCDGNAVELTDGMQLQLLFGNMLVSLLTEMRADGTLAQLPLASNAYMTVQEFDFTFFWPEEDTENVGRIVPEGR